jgi:hypothetical protein
MELYTKFNDDFIKFDLVTFDKAFIENKLVHINIGSEGFYLTPEDLEAIAKTFGEYFKPLGSDVIVTQGCSVDIFLIDKPNSRQCMIIKNDQTNQK